MATLAERVSERLGFAPETIDAILSERDGLVRMGQKGDGLHKGCGGLEGQCEMPLVQREVTPQQKLVDVQQVLRRVGADLAYCHRGRNVRVNTARDAIAQACRSLADAVAGLDEWTREGKTPPPGGGEL